MWIEILLALLTIFCLVYWYVTKSFGKWKNLGIPYCKGTFPFGTYNFLSETHFDVLNTEDHKKFAKERYFGWFMLGKPILAINDVNLLKHIEVKDFDHFVDRQGVDVSEKMFSGGDLDKIWRLQLTSLVGEEWKQHRSAFTPVFTSGKMKGMMKFIKKLAVDLTNDLEEKAAKNEEFELKETLGKFSIDSIASSAFGVDAESFTNKDSKFAIYASQMSKSTLIEFAVSTVKFLPGVPQIISFLQLNLNKPKETRFFRDVILQTIKHRRETKERRNDMVDLMLDCIDDGKATDEEEDKNEEHENVTQSRKQKHKLDEISVVATAMILLVAGYDTTAILLSYLSYELSRNPEIQKKLQEEIDEAYEDSDGEIPDYSTIQNLPYLDMVVHETLRFHSPTGMNTRIVTKDYKLPESDIVLKTNDMVSWNAQSLHFDPDHWSHPDEFYPEHFSKEEKSARNPYAFQAFGQGPRACIGMRFALLETKVAIISVLRKFSFKQGTKTTEPLVIDPEYELFWPKGGLWANVELRQDV